MRIKLDENLPQRLVPALAALNHDVDTVFSEGLQGHDDEQLWPAVQATGRFLITKDLGFSDERRFAPGTHAGILVLRLSDDRSRTVADRLTAVFSKGSIETWPGYLVIVTDHKVCGRRPQPRVP